MRISLCVGNYAKTPYCIPALQINVYSVEELCVCMKENAFLLDISFMNIELANWIQNECGLMELARELTVLIRKRGSLSAFVTIIMEYVGFFDETVIGNVEKVLKDGAGLDSLEKKKRQVDYLLSRKKYSCAIKEYLRLLEEWDKEGEENLKPPEIVKAGILNNIGVCLAGLFEYSRAASYFYDSYLISHSEETALSYLGAKRMLLTDEEYLNFITESPEFYKTSLLLEKKLNESLNEYSQSEKFKLLEDMDLWRSGADKQKYYEKLDIITGLLKDEYRESVSE